MLLWRILLLVCSVIVGGCAGVRQVPLPESESSRFAGRTLQRTAYAKTHSGLYVQGARSGSLGDPGLLIGDRIVRAHAERAWPTCFDMTHAKRGWRGH
jgi:hypothetical protein